MVHIYNFNKSINSYLRWNNPVIYKFLRSVKAILRKPVGYVNSSCVTLMWWVKTLRSSEGKAIVVNKVHYYLLLVLTDQITHITTGLDLHWESIYLFIGKAKPCFVFPSHVNRYIFFRYKLIPLVMKKSILCQKCYHTHTKIIQKTYKIIWRWSFFPSLSFLGVPCLFSQDRFLLRDVGALCSYGLVSTYHIWWLMIKAYILLFLHPDQLGFKKLCSQRIYNALGKGLAQTHSTQSSLC